MAQGTSNGDRSSNIAAAIADHIATKARTEQPRKRESHGVDEDAILERMGKEFLAALDTKDPKQVARLLRAHIRNAMKGGRDGD